MATLADQKKIAELGRAVLGTSALISETFTRLGFLKRAIDESPGADTTLARRVRSLEAALRDAQEFSMAIRRARAAMKRRRRHCRDASRERSPTDGATRCRR